MYNLYTIKDTFELSPENFDKDIESVAELVLQKKYEGVVDKELGIIITVFDVKNISDGIIYPGDPNTHHNAEFNVLTFMPYVDEIIIGEVSDITNFGAFVRIGPMEGLVHVSQIAGEFLSFDRKTQTFVSKQGKISLKKGDVVYAKVSTVSMKKSIKDSKIALSMKHDGLGKPEWFKLASSQKHGKTNAKRHRAGKK